jgi:hypothetical protein
MSISENDRAALNQLGFATAEPGAAARYEVPGVMEAIATCATEHNGVPIALVSRHGRELGTLAHKDAELVRARPDLWAPLYVTLAYR